MELQAQLGIIHAHEHDLYLFDSMELPTLLFHRSLGVLTLGPVQSPIYNRVFCLF